MYIHVIHMYMTQFGFQHRDGSIRCTLNRGSHVVGFLFSLIIVLVNGLISGQPLKLS